MTEPLPVGKLPPELLASLLASIGEGDDSVIIGPGPGRDAAAVLRRTLGQRLHALHDPTEGGLATGLRELGVAAGLGLTVDGREIPYYPETDRICESFGINALGLIASGALLAVVAPGAVEAALAALRNAGLSAARIGSMEEDPAYVRIIDGCLAIPLPTFPVDEFARLLAESSQSM